MERAEAMSASRGNPRDTELPSPAEISPDPHTHTEDPSFGVARLALVLMTELGACLQLISRDIARATNLDEASARWSERLMALAEMIERATGRYTAHKGRHNRALPHSASASATNSVPQPRQELPIPHPTQHPTQHSHPKSSALTYLQPQPLKLTAREREVVALTRRGYPPRRIAKHLQLSVETVYTHLRNARRKQRLTDPPASS